MSKILAIIVTYNSHNDLLKNLDSIIGQVDEIIIIDNNSDEYTKGILRSIKNIEIIYNDVNLGIAAAQNIGIKKAIKENFQWVLLLDDDSYLEEDMIQNLLLEYYKYKEKDKISILVPNIIERKIHHNMKYIIKSRFFFKKKSFEENEEYLDNILTIISSGSLIKVGSFKKYGLMNENFFIDYVDTEFALRMISKNQKIMAIRKAVLIHEVGSKTEIKIGKYKIRTSNHDSSRLYFMYRNRIFVWKKYFFKVFPYVLYDIIYSNYQFLNILLFEKKRKDKIFKILKGIRDGVFNIENKQI